jgi:hypothetical protein
VDLIGNLADDGDEKVRLLALVLHRELQHQLKSHWLKRPVHLLIPNDCGFHPVVLSRQKIESPHAHPPSGAITMGRKECKLPSSIPV